MCYIFSLCGTVLYSDTRTFLQTLWKDSARAQRLHEIVFESPEWRMLTEGTITREDAMEWLTRRSPAEAEHIRLALKHWPRCLTPRWETVELLLDMRKQEKRLFFAAELDTSAKDYVLKTYPFMTLFEGGVFSCDGHLLHSAVCALYGLEPGQCLWIDQNRERTAKAEKTGMRGIVFTGAERFRDLLI